MKKSILVTGCNGGIGKMICQEFLSQGWNVFGVDISNADHELSSDVNFIRSDISNGASRKELCGELREKTGGILNGLVNNAAIQICKPFFEMNESEWDQIMNVNLKAPFFMVQELYGLLRHASGAIVNISSVHAKATSDQIAAYASSKGGLSAMTRALAIECAKDGVRVNAIQPGAIDTEMLRRGLSRGHIIGTSIDDLVEGIGKKHIVNRVGKPKEIGRLTYFLVEDAGFMTGESITIDGGATIKLSTE